MALKGLGTVDGVDKPLSEDIRYKSQQCGQLDQYVTKNVLIISLCFMLLYIAFNGLQFLQSSLHTEEGLGLAVLSVMYGGFALSNLLGLAPAVISTIGLKWAMVAGMSAYLPWLVVNGYAKWYTIVPTAFLQGLGAGPLWVSKAAYLTITANNVARKGEEDMVVIVHRYFGVIVFALSLSSLIGPAISSAILHVKDEGITMYNNRSVAAPWSKCGPRDCPGNPINETAIEPQDPNKVWFLAGVYGGCALLAVLILTVTLDDQARPGQKSATSSQTRQVVLSVVRHHRHRRQLLLIPACLQQGWALGFFFGEFTKSFAGCVFGVWMVGVITLPFGLAQSIMALAAGGMVKYTGRLLPMTMAHVCDLALMIVLLCWDGYGGHYVIYILSVLPGITDAIKRTVLDGTISYLFPDDPETAFSAAKFWGAAGWIVPFAYSKYICTSTKIWVLLAITLLAGCSFIMLENTCCTGKNVYGAVARKDIEKNGECKKTPI